jgi:hypothetical protein
MECTRRGYMAQLRVLVERQLAELNAADSADQALAGGRAAAGGAPAWQGSLATE